MLIPGKFLLLFPKNITFLFPTPFFIFFIRILQHDQTKFHQEGLIMRKKHVTLLLAALLTVGLVGGILAGCGSQTSPAGTDTAAEVSRNTEGGVITLKVN